MSNQDRSVTRLQLQERLTTLSMLRAEGVKDEGLHEEIKQLVVAIVWGREPYPPHKELYNVTTK